MRSVKDFEADLVARLRKDRIPGDLINEADLERRFVLPIVRDLMKQGPGPHVYAHPWKHRGHCAPNCSGLVEQPELHGCPDCWNQSKDWAAVRLYGLHCFDLVVSNREESFGVELKLLRHTGHGNQRSNAGFQRVLGQCMLGKLIHPRMLAFCAAEKGALDMSATDHVDALGDQGITLMVKTFARRR